MLLGTQGPGGQAPQDAKKLVLVAAQEPREQVQALHLHSC